MSLPKTPFQPGQSYFITNHGNNNEMLFPEPQNVDYFLRLFKSRAGCVAQIIASHFIAESFQLIVRFHPAQSIPKKYRLRLHQPLSNFFNAYAKAFNKKYNRTGSLFREHFHRESITDEQLDRFLENNPQLAARSDNQVEYAPYDL